MNYILNVTNLNTNEVVCLAIQADHELSSAELTGLKESSRAVFDAYKKNPVSAVNYSDLNIKPLSSDTISSEKTVVNAIIRKVRDVESSKRIFKSRLQIFKKLLNRKPNSFHKFLWVVFVAPFLCLHKFHTQHQRYAKKLHKVFGTNVYTQKQILLHLERLNSNLHKVMPDLKNNRALLETFDLAVLSSEQIVELATSKDKDVAEVAKRISTPLMDRMEDLSSPFLGMVPVSLKMDGNDVPIFFMFRKEEKNVVLDIKGLPNNKSCLLNGNYVISNEKAKEVIPSIIETILRTTLAQADVSKRNHLSRRERIRLRNLERLGIEPYVPSPQAKKSDPVAWLNEMLCNVSTPMETDEIKTKPNRDPFLQLSKDLESYFPDISSADKTELMLTSIEEEYSALFQVMPRLSQKDQIFFLERLNEKMQKVQHRCKDKLKDYAAIDPLFKKFSDRLQEFKIHQTKMKPKILKSQAERLSKELSLSKKSLPQVALPDDISIDDQAIQANADSTISVSQKKMLADLETSVANNDLPAALNQLKALHREADRLIEKKGYLIAQELALSALSVLPVPTNQNDNFWEKFAGNNTLNALSQEVTDLVKDIWEGSLRLNFTYPQPNQLIQLFKAQTIQVKLWHRGSPETGHNVDYEEISKIVHLHPHLRFGWRPEHQQELKQIVDFIENEKSLYRISRIDTEIKNNNPLRPPIHRSQGMSLEEEFRIDFLRLQVMVSSLMKPDYCLAPFYGSGKLQQALGLSWLDGLEAKAVAAGANTPAEIQQGIKLIRLKETQSKLRQLQRLELGIGRFVTEFACVTIVDGKSPNSHPALAYLPNGYGLPRDYQARYGVSNNQANTTPLVGSARGEEKFVGPRDGVDIQRSRGLEDCLSPQIINTEPTLLRENLQRAPKGQISQVENYLLDASQIYKPDASQITNFFTLNEGSILEGLALLFGERNLADPDVQRTILLLLSRSFLLEEELNKSPREILAVAYQMRELLAKKIKDPVVFPFLLQIGQIIKEHAVYLQASNNNPLIDEIAKAVPCFDNLLQIEERNETGKKWLESILKDPEKEHTSAAIAYLYALMDRPIEGMDEETLKFALFSASFFGSLADSTGLPMFNRMVEKWISETMLPQIGACLQQEDFPLQEFLNKWIELLVPANSLQLHSAWKMVSREPMIIENDQISIDLFNLQVNFKKTKKPVAVQKVAIPQHVQRSTMFLSLFGDAPLRAELSKGNDPNLFFYTFSFGQKKTLYRAIYNQSNGKVDVYCQLPLNPLKKESKNEWHMYVSSLNSAGESAIERCIAKQGVWVNQKNCKKAYLIAAPLTVAKRSEMYRVALSKQGSVLSVKSLSGTAEVAFLSPKATETIIPIVNGQETLVLASKGKVKKIRCLDRKSEFQKDRAGRWGYSDPQLGDGWKWDIDLSAVDAQAPEKSQEKRFLQQFSGDHIQFLLPLSQGKEKQFLVLPHEIQPTLSHGLHFVKGDYSHLSPATISFGKEGEIKGSPSSLLYLSYYFAMKKDYERALFYIEKAKQMPAYSEKEKVTFERIASLFDKIPNRSFAALSFQLKAQLAIREITGVQFSRTIYNREGEGQFFANVSHITQLYKKYRLEAKRCADRGEMIPMKLSEEEEFTIQRIQWVSFDDWLAKQADKDLEAAKNRVKEPLHVPDDLFLNTKINADKMRDFPQGIMSTCALLASNLDQQLSEEQLTSKGIPDAEHIVRHAFHFYNTIATGDARQVLNYLLAPPSWQLNLPEADHDKRLAEIAEELRTFLTLACVMRLKGEKLQVIDLKAAAKIQKNLPHWGRDNIKPIRMILAIYDLQLLTAHKIKRSLRDLFNISDFQNCDEFQDKTIGELLELIPERASKVPKDTKEETSAGGISLQAVLDYFENPSPDHSYLPLEVFEIPDLIKKENTDLNKVRDILTLMRESESRKFPVLQIRALSENMHEIQQLEKTIAVKAKARTERAEKIAPISVNIEALLNLKNLLTKETASFNTLTENDKKQQKAHLANLEKKYQAAKGYVESNQETPPAMVEEYHQLQLGFERAKQTIKEEVERKSTFSSEEMASFKQFLKKHVDNPNNQPDSLAAIYRKKREQFLTELRVASAEALPKSLRKMLEAPDLYTDFDLIQETLRLYKDPRHNGWLLSHQAQFDRLITETLLYMTAFHQLSNAYGMLSGEASEVQTAKALEIVRNGFEFDRYCDKESDPLVARKSLVAEARAGIIYRPGQREIINKIAHDSSQWLSLRMGLGKTSYAIPTIAEILAEQGKSVVITVPEKLLKSNRKDIDKATRMLFDQAGFEFSLPLTKELPWNFLAEKVKQLEETIKNKGYVITTVDELATLHDTCIMLEDEKLKIHDQDEINETSGIQLIHIEARLHYYRKIDRILNGEAVELNVPHALFGDETDETHHITHEVSIAVGEKVDPSKQVREVSRTILEHLLSAKAESVLGPLKKALIANTYPVMTEREVSGTHEKAGYMQMIAEGLMNDETFLKLLGDKGKFVQKLNPKEWADYLTGKLTKLPQGMPEWREDDVALKETQTMIACAKQLLTDTFPNFLSQKAGNDVGLSDFDGFVVVPKVTKNETKGMRYADEFEMIFAQYIGYLEFLPCESLTDESSKFLALALKTLKEKSPSAYDLLLKDYQKFVINCQANNQQVPELFDYLVMPEAYSHRWNIVDQVVFDSGFIKRFSEQIQTNVQEMFHKRPCGGVTGTLDPYVLPYISDEVQLHQKEEDKNSSTREVEAETFLRMGLNVEKGLNQLVKMYVDERSLDAVNAILGDMTTTAFINSNGATSEGMNTLTWIEKIRQTSNGKKRSYLFMHPTERIPYLWDGAAKPVPYKGQFLPDNTICVYPPSDVRGVDLPIRKGKVHMFVSPTASPQEFVQSLYRARQLGGDHELVMHLPHSLNEKIVEGKRPVATYGEVINYLISRSTQMKLALNLKAQLKKVEFELKTAVTKYLKEINPEHDQRDFWCRDNLENIVVNTKAQAAIFKVLRTLYIKKKEIDFKVCYAPREFISGTDKVLEEFDNVRKVIQGLIEPLEEASIESAGCMLYQKGNKDANKGMESFMQELALSSQALLKLIARAKNKSYNSLSQPLGLLSIQLMNPSKKSRDQKTIFSMVSKLQLSIHQTMIAQSESQHNSEVLAEMKQVERLITESIYGKGKSHLCNTLSTLLQTLDTQKADFNKKKEAHEKYLPAQTAKSSVGNAGSNEQVKEMQHQQTQEILKVAEDPDQLKIKGKNAKRDYKPIETHELLSHEFNDLEQTSFGFGLSHEARDLLDVPSMMTGDPLVYIAIDQKGDHPKITLITKMDYHSQIKKDLSKDGCANLAVYEPTPTGFRWIGGGDNTDFRKTISDQIANSLRPMVMKRLMAVKVYLGYKEEFADSENKALIEWKQLLNSGERKGILSYVGQRGTPAQRKILQALLED